MKIADALVCVVSCRDSFPRAAAEQFLTIADSFEGTTAALVGSGQIFSES